MFSSLLCECFSDVFNMNSNRTTIQLIATWMKIWPCFTKNVHIKGDHSKGFTYCYLPVYINSPLFKHSQVIAPEPYCSHASAAWFILIIKTSIDIIPPSHHIQNHKTSEHLPSPFLSCLIVSLFFSPLSFIPLTFWSILDLEYFFYLLDFNTFRLRHPAMKIGRISLKGQNEHRLNQVNSQYLIDHYQLFQ